MKIVCAWCKKEMGEKAPYDDLSISHTICRDCSIKFLGVDPDARKERMSSNPVVDPRPPKRKKGTTGWKFYSSSRNKRDAQFEAMHARRSGWLPMLKLNKYSDRYEVWVTTKGNPGTAYHFGKEQEAVETLERKDISDTMRAFYRGKREAHHASYWDSKRLGINPASSERQRKFMCAELGRLRAGKKTRTGMKEKSLRDFCRKSKNPVTSSKRSMLKRVVKETAEYLRKAGYDKDSAYMSIYNRLKGVPDELIRSSITEVYRVGKNPKGYMPLWKSDLISRAERQKELGYLADETIDYLKNQHKDIPEKSIASAVAIAYKRKTRRRRR